MTMNLTQWPSAYVSCVSIFGYTTNELKLQLKIIHKNTKITREKNYIIDDNTQTMQKHSDLRIPVHRTFTAKTDCLTSHSRTCPCDKVGVSQGLHRNDAQCMHNQNTDNVIAFGVNLWGRTQSGHNDYQLGFLFAIVESEMGTLTVVVVGTECQCGKN